MDIPIIGTKAQVNMSKPEFDPKKPFDASKPAFNDTQAFTKSLAPTTPAFSDQNVIQEMPDDVSWIDRAKVKNFANDTGKASEFLRQKYPQYDISGDDKNYYFQKKGTNEPKKVLDPQTPFWSMAQLKDLPYDLTDVGWDVGSGVGSSAASAGGGLLAGMPGASIGGGLSSGALEALRQKLGVVLGINEKIKPDDVAVATGLGAAAPLVFGSGATANQIAKAATAKAAPIIESMMGSGAVTQDMKEALTKALTSKTATDIAESQKGVLSKGYDWATRKAAPWLASTLNGIPERTMQTLASKLGVIQGMENTGIKPHMDNLIQDVKSTLGDAIFSKGQALGDTIDAAKVPVNIDAAKQPFLNEIDKLKSYQHQTPEVTEQIKEIEAYMGHIFGEGETQMSGNVAARDAFRVQHSVNDLAEFPSIKGGITSRLTGGMSVAEKQLANAAAASSKAINSGLDSATSTADSLMGSSGSLKKELSDLYTMRKDIAPKFADSQKLYSALSGMDAKGKKIFFENLKNFDSKFGKNVTDQAKILEALATFSNASKDAISSGGSTSTSRSTALGTLGAGVGGWLGNKLGGPAGTGVGIALGGFAGAKAASPAFTRWAIENGLEAEAKAASLKPLINNRAAQSLPYSAWNTLNSSKNE